MSVDGSFRDGCIRTCTRSTIIQTSTMLSEKRTDYIPVCTIPMRVWSSILSFFWANPGKEHCLNHLRKSAMCHGDVGMVTYRWGNNSRKPYASATKHQCIDWDTLADWTDKRTVNMFQPGYLVHPTLGESTNFCDPFGLLQVTTDKIAFWNRAGISRGRGQRSNGLIVMDSMGE